MVADGNKVRYCSQRQPIGRTNIKVFFKVVAQLLYANAGYHLISPHHMNCTITDKNDMNKKNEHANPERRRNTRS